MAFNLFFLFLKNSNGHLFPIETRRRFDFNVTLGGYLGRYLTIQSYLKEWSHAAPKVKKSHWKLWLVSLKWIIEADCKGPSNCCWLFHALIWSNCPRCDIKIKAKKLEVLNCIFAPEIQSGNIDHKNHRNVNSILLQKITVQKMLAFTFNEMHQPVKKNLQYR